MKFFFRHISIFYLRFRLLRSFGYLSRKEAAFLNRDLLGKSGIKLGLLTVAFNNADIITFQYNQLKRNLLDNFVYVIVDNSTNQEESRKMAQFSKDLGLVYVKLPPNPFSGLNPSKSHGLAVNYAYKNVVAKSAISHFGFLDHDIFPAAETTIMEKLDHKPFYGLVQKRGGVCYLWAGFCFFSKEYLVGKRVNFMPVRGLDTGGGNYALYDPRIIARIANDHFYVNLKTNSRVESSYQGIQKDCIEVIDGWVHLMDSSNWSGGTADKNKFDLTFILKSIHYETHNR